MALASRSYLHIGLPCSLSVCNTGRQIYRLDSLGALLVIRLVSVSSSMLSLASATPTRDPLHHLPSFMLILLYGRIRVFQ